MLLKNLKMNPVERVVAVAIVALTLGGSAFAADGPDTTAILAAIAAAVISIGLVGTAILGMRVAIKAFVWVRAAMAG
jgi:hypothetical protein